jgi:hypothetical protein
MAVVLSTLQCSGCQTMGRCIFCYAVEALLKERYAAIISYVSMPALLTYTTYHPNLHSSGAAPALVLPDPLGNNAHYGCCLC